MGIGLSSPVESKVLYRLGSPHFRVGGATMQGYRYHMEDAHSMIPDLIPNAKHPVGFFGVYDGHGGTEASKFIASIFHKHVSQLNNPRDQKKLKECCIATDKDLLKELPGDDGSTAVFAVVVKVGETYEMTVGNIGDSRVVLARKGTKSIGLTTDHKPTDKKEKKRIMKAGGVVVNQRVAGTLALSRAFGDKGFKIPTNKPPEEQMVTVVPDFTTEKATKDDFLFLACDGIFENDCFTRESAISFIAEKLKQTTDLAIIVKDLLDECLARGSHDNMSAFIVQFTDGTDYQREEEFWPGPYHEGKEHSSFQRAYIANAESNGHTLEQAISKYQHNMKLTEENKSTITERNNDKGEN
jgi:protein phosphatase